MGSPCPPHMHKIMDYFLQYPHEEKDVLDKIQGLITKIKVCLLVEDEFMVRVLKNKNFLSLHSDTWLMLVYAKYKFLLRVKVKSPSIYRLDEQIYITNSVKLS